MGEQVRGGLTRRHGDAETRGRRSCHCEHKIIQYPYSSSPLVAIRQAHGPELVEGERIEVRGKIANDVAISKIKSFNAEDAELADKAFRRVTQSLKFWNLEFGIWILD